MIKAFKYNDGNNVYLFDDTQLSEDLVSSMLETKAPQPFVLSKAHPYGVYLTNEQYENLIMKLLNEFAKLHAESKASESTKHTEAPKVNEKSEPAPSTCKMGHDSDPVNVKIVELSPEELHNLVLYGLHRFF